MKSLHRIGFVPVTKDQTTNKLNVPESSEVRLYIDASVYLIIIGTKASKHTANPYCDQLAQAHFQ